MPEKTVDAYLASLEDWQAAIGTRLREIITATAPHAEEAIKWAQPVYSHRGPFMYFKAFKKSVNVGFWRGVSLSDPDGLLEGSGVKMRHVPIRSVEEIDEETLQKFIRQAIQLNKEFGDPTR